MVNVHIASNRPPPAGADGRRRGPMDESSARGITYHPGSNAEAKPTQPAPPAQTAQPSRPARPAPPAQTAAPAQTGAPAPPAKPAAPAKAAAPAQPARPARPRADARLAHLITELQGHGLRVEVPMESRQGGAGPADAGMLWIDGV